MIELKDLRYSYKAKRNPNEILHALNYVFDCGKCYAIKGQSGSGKTTLLSLIAGLDSPTSGDVLYNGVSIQSLNLDEYRAKSIGVIFQNFNLISYLNAIENVQLSLHLSGQKENTYTKALNLLKQLGIEEHVALRRVTVLSGGEMQRVAIARALAGEPEIIIADEPTGNLDEENQQNIVEIFKYIAHEHNKCVIIASHSISVISQADLVLSLT